MGNTAAAIGSGVLAVLLCFTASAADEDEARNEGLFLVKALAHPDSGVRQAAANSLRQLEGEALTTALDGLVLVLREGHPVYAVVVASALADTRLVLDEKVAAKLTESLYDVLADPRTPPRNWAATAQVLRRRAPKTLADHTELWAAAIRVADPLRSYEAVRTVAFLSVRATAETERATAELELIEKRKGGKNVDEKQRTKLEKEARDELAKLEQAAGARRAVLEPALLSLLDWACPWFAEVAVDSRVVTVGQLGYVLRTPLEDRLLVLRTLVELEADADTLAAPLLRLTRTTNQYVALEAAQLVGRLQDGPGTSGAKAEAAHVLAALATLPNGRVLPEAAASVGELGDEALAVLPTLVDLLADRVADVRVGAAKSLGELGPAAASAVPALKRAARFEKLNNAANAKTMTDAVKKIEKK